MKKLRDEFINKLDDFFRNEKSEYNFLAKWANEKIIQLLNTNEIFELDNLTMYPLLNALAITDSWERYSDNQIREIYRTITGNKTTEYSCYIKLTHAVNIKEIEEIILSYENNGEFSGEQKDIILDFKNNIEKQTNICDILYAKLLVLIESLPNQKNFEINANTIFVAIEEIDSNDILKDIQKLIGYLKGSMAFHITILYSNENSSILIT